MAGDKPLLIYSTAIAPEWIDYNGHLRDAYYGLVLSYAADALMDHLGLDEAYRKATSATLYTLEQHLHFLHEVMKSDHLEVRVRLLAADAKRMHAAFDFYSARYPDPVAIGEVMLLHVQQGAAPASAPFPAAIAQAVTALVTASAGIPAPGPPSRQSVIAASCGGCIRPDPRQRRFITTVRLMNCRPHLIRPSSPSPRPRLSKWRVPCSGAVPAASSVLRPDSLNSAPRRGWS